MPPDTEPLAHKQLAQMVADHLREGILEGRLRPGQWLRQEHLAQQHGVSQMPVREALKRLVSEGLVEHVPYRGVRVVQFEPEDVEDLYVCRAFIEAMAARHAAASIEDDELGELEALHQRMSTCVGDESITEYRELNRRFHSLIFTASRRSYLVRNLAQLWAAFPTMLWSNFAQTARWTPPDRVAPDTEEHEAILAALRDRDGAAAERAVRRHIEQAGQELLAALGRHR
jgi:DNA-binding GntR family transcriptional regulator